MPFDKLSQIMLCIIGLITINIFLKTDRGSGLFDEPFLDNINMLYTSVAEGSLNEDSEGGELGLFKDSEVDKLFIEYDNGEEAGK